MVFNLSEKYQVSSIKSKVSHLLQSSLTPGNACELAILAHLHDDQGLLDRSLKVLKSNLFRARNSKGWARLEKEYPLLLTKILLLDAEGRGGDVAN